MNGEAGPKAGLPLHSHPTLPRQPLHVVRHAGPCGLRIRSPHAECQTAVEPYLGAERASVTFRGADGVHVHVIVIRCHVCGRVSQFGEAAA